MRSRSNDYSLMASNANEAIATRRGSMFLEEKVAMVEYLTDILCYLHLFTMEKTVGTDNIDYTIRVDNRTSGLCPQSITFEGLSRDTRGAPNMADELSNCCQMWLSEVESWVERDTSSHIRDLRNCSKHRRPLQVFWKCQQSQISILIAVTSQWTGEANASFSGTRPGSLVPPFL